MYIYIYMLIFFLQKNWGGPSVHAFMHLNLDNICQMMRLLGFRLKIQCQCNVIFNEFVKGCSRSKCDKTTQEVHFLELDSN